MIAELMLHVCASLSSSSLHRCSLISSTDQMEQPRISTSLLSPELSSSPKRNGRQKKQTLIQTEGFFSLHKKQMHTHFSLTVLKCLHQSIRISQSSKVDKCLRDPVVRKHGEPPHVGDISFSSGLHDAPEISHQDLSSLVE